MRRLIVSFTLMALGASLAVAEQRQPERPAAIALAVDGAACVAGELGCREIAPGQFLYPGNVLEVSRGTVTVYFVEDRTRVALPKGRHPVEASTFHVPSDRFAASRISQLLSLTPRHTATAATRSAGTPQCIDPEVFRRTPDWLGSCIEAIPAERVNTDQIDAVRGQSEPVNANQVSANQINGNQINANPIKAEQGRVPNLPQYSHYRDWPMKELDALQADGFIVASRQGCRKVAHFGDIVLEQEAPVYLIDARSLELVTYGLAPLPTACQGALDAELATLDALADHLTPVELREARHTLYLSYDLRFLAIQALE